jgi:hypothetical protein
MTSRFVLQKCRLRIKADTARTPVVKAKPDVLPETARQNDTTKERKHA